VLVLLLVFAVLLVVSACGAEQPSAKGAAAPPREPAEVETSQALGEDVALSKDARYYAEDVGVSLEEAIRRLKLQQEIGTSGLERALARNEADTFAGLWIQHRPDYRVVVLFTEGGEETIGPYIEGKPWADLVLARNGADATLAELRAAQAEAERIADELGIEAGSSIDVMGNRVELLVEDPEHLNSALRSADLRLPEHVKVAEGVALPASG
jgi:pyruvate/2-oxoglutarate dehydrogenase complex dihydrolipoamide acyltransferase (E2) component